MGVVKKRDSVVQPAVAMAPGASSEFALRFPCIQEMLSVVHYPDGEARRTSTFTVFLEDGVAKVCLNDRDNGLTGWASGADALLAMDSLEAMLAADTVVWRAAGQVMRGRKKRV